MARKREISSTQLESIVPPPLLMEGSEAKKEADSSFADESREYDNEAKKLANRHSALKNQELSDTLAQRKKYAERTFILVCCWISVVLVVLLLQGFGAFGSRLSDKVLAVTVGSTTVNVLGMLAIVLHGLYPTSRSK